MNVPKLTFVAWSALKIASAVVVALLVSKPDLALSYEEGLYECGGAFSSAMVKIRPVQIEPEVKVPFVVLTSMVRGSLRQIRGFAQVYIRQIQKKDSDGKPVRDAKNEIVYVSEEVIRMDIPSDLAGDFSSEVLRFDPFGNIKNCEKR